MTTTAVFANACRRPSRVTRFVPVRCVRIAEGTPSSVPNSRRAHRVPLAGSNPAPRLSGRQAAALSGLQAAALSRELARALNAAPATQARALSFCPSAVGAAGQRTRAFYSLCNRVAGRRPAVSYAHVLPGGSDGLPQRGRGQDLNGITPAKDPWCDL